MRQQPCYVEPVVDLSEPLPDTGQVRRPCGDCVEERGMEVRPRILPDGKRCAEHIRVRKVAGRLRNFWTYVKRTYGLTERQWRALYRAQGGRCAICRRARGISKMLGVDHDHRCCPGPKSCGKCVRGLLCSGSLSANTCNRLIALYTVEDLDRAAAYVRNPPAPAVLAALEEEAA